MEAFGDLGIAALLKIRRISADTDCCHFVGGARWVNDYSFWYYTLDIVLCLLCQLHDLELVRSGAFQFTDQVLPLT